MCRIWKHFIPWIFYSFLVLENCEGCHGSLLHHRYGCRGSNRYQRILSDRDGTKTIKKYSYDLLLHGRENQRFDPNFDAEIHLLG